uniref:MHC class I-like antigen recognition-like domain-containing protein n=1 Tax=Molossus molossus TaxID=27622 RepID=A0A7J8GQD6_MOLMO|nr:hypothetical protein HJG59_011371 [Molossus molossus]
MVRTSGSRFSLILLVLALLPDCPRAADCPLLRGGAISLGYKFTITPSGQPWCEIQGQANGNTFFSFTCGSKQVKLINIQETKRNDTEAWNQQRDTLKYVMEELKKKLLEVRAEKSAISNSLFLQGNIKCEESSEDRMAYSDFGLNKYTSVRLNSDTRSWIVLKDEGRMLKEILASDRAMTDLLVKTSAGDCRMWLKQVLCHQDGVLSTKEGMTGCTNHAPGHSYTKHRLSCTGQDHINNHSLHCLRCAWCARFGYGFHQVSSSVTIKEDAAQSSRGCGLVQHVSFLVGCPSLSSCSPAELQELQSLQQMQRPPEDPEDTADAIPMSFIA